VKVEIILNALLYVSFFFIFYLKKKRLDLGVLILLVFAISNVISVFYYSFDYVRPNFNNITFQPFLYLFILYIICLVPFQRISDKHINSISAKGSLPFLFILSCSLIFISIVPLIENIVLVIKNRGNDAIISSIYDSRNQGEKIEIYSLLGRRLNYISSLFLTTSIICFFYFLSLPKRRNLLIFGLSLIIVNNVLYYYNTSNRAGIIICFLFIITCFFLFKNILDKRVLSFIKYTGFFFILLVITIIGIVTAARLDNSSNTEITALSWLSLYGGEGSLKFNNDLWHIKYHTNGDDIFCFVKNLLGFETFKESLARDNYYNLKNGIQIENFYTVLGDVFFDFGLVLTPIFCFIINRIIYFLTRKREVYPLDIIFLIAFFAHIFILGFSAFIYRSYDAQFGLIFPFIVICILYLNRKSKRRISY
jgi:oligosaccharide repeat unit polymerase